MTIIIGLLTPVENLSATYNETAIIFNWTAPFTLDITNFDSDIEGYCATITNGSMGHVYTRCGIANTFFIYDIPKGSRCGNFTLSVFAVNLVGNGTENSISVFIDDGNYSMHMHSAL